MESRADEMNDESDDEDTAELISQGYCSLRQSSSSIDNFFNYFWTNYDSTPFFSDDSLEGAINSAMESTNISDRSPVLIYLHHRNSLFVNIFCSRIFCHEKMTEYLINNYVVWPFDLTSTLNQTKFNEIWEKLFLSSFELCSIIDKYPILIGIKHCQLQSPLSTRSKYEYEILRISDRNDDNLESILEKLQIFKRKFLKDEKNAPTTFFNEMRLPKNVRKRILSYLTFDEIIMSFSPGIIPWLQENQIPLQIVFPSSNNYADDILKHFLAANVKSLHLIGDRLVPNQQYPILDSFSNIQSITVINANESDFYSTVLRRFLHIHSWTFSYDSEYSLTRLINLITSSYISPRRLTIRCGKISCSHQFFPFYLPNANWTQLQDFTLDVKFCSLIRQEMCYGGHSSCILHCLHCCLKNLNNLQNLRLIINMQDVENLLFEHDLWSCLLSDCSQLRNIFIYVNETIPEELLQIINQVQSNLSMEKDGLIFQLRASDIY